MAVARTHHTKDYTCMSNYHFKDKSISLKAKGLLSLMLSLPDEWDYSVAGLAVLSSDGETSVRTAVKELEEHNYLKRTPVRDGGRIIDWEYDIYEKPVDYFLQVENQQVETLLQENTDNKILKQSNTKKENKKNNSKELLQNSPSFEFGKSKPKKESLYTACSNLIRAKSDDGDIQHLLFDWLNMLLEKYRARGKSLYVNVFKGKLNMLDKYDKKDWKAIIEFNLQKGYEGFYPVSDYRTNIDEKPWEKGVKSDSYTEEEKRQIEKEREEMIARGEKVWF